MPLGHIAQILRQHIGLHAESVGQSAISSAVGCRMASLKIGSVQEYLQRLHAGGDELTHLIETVVIPETWFFRDRKPFQFLEMFVLERNTARPTLPLRALSVPCATGEEPYSIAMTCLGAGVAAERIQIDAVDISRRALDFALAGNYGAHSFRGEQDPQILARYFQPDGARFQISAAVRNLVNFIHGNLLDPHFQFTAASYDAIFCRNLMIYFDDHARSLAYRTLQRLLAPHGVLFVGHAESGTVPTELFHSAGQASGFAFRNGPARRKPVPAPATARSAPNGRRQSVSRSVQHRRQSIAVPPPSPTEPLELARQLADLGRLEEARLLCEAQLDRPGRQADLYSLLGTIHMAEGNLDAAEKALRRTLYLNPKHYQCLVQLALLLQQKGEHDASAKMRRRAQRAAPQQLDG